KELDLVTVRAERDSDSLKLAGGRWVAVPSSRLRELTQEEVKGLWAVHLKASDGAAWGRLEELDLERASVAVEVESGIEALLTPLPRGVRRLSLDLSVWGDSFDARRLSGLRRLEFLNMGGFCGGRIDLAALKESTGLRFLNLHGRKVRRLESLRNAKEM